MRPQMKANWQRLLPRTEANTFIGERRLSPYRGPGIGNIGKRASTSVPTAEAMIVAKYGTHGIRRSAIKLRVSKNNVRHSRKL